MSKILIINAHHYYPFSEGRLNETLVNKAEQILSANGHEIRTVKTEHDYVVSEQVANHQWADIILLQSPVNWMGVPWSCKKYMDDVYSGGLEGQLCNGDGRTSEAPKANYGGGGTLVDSKYMLSLTFNAPEEAFNNPSEYLFQGKSVDDLFFPVHMNFRFFGMQSLPTFVCFDVMKNPQIENDLMRFEQHLNEFI